MDEEGIYFDRMDRSCGNCGLAQIFVALVLALVTVFLWKSTNKYATLTEKNLEMKEKVRQIERYHEELDKIIGPFYSKLKDQIYFNPKP